MMAGISEEALIELADRVGRVLRQRQWLLTTAESCTGGWVAQVVTSVSGSSEWFDRGFVTYSNQSKREMLSVAGQTLDDYGAVSEAVVREMAAGALQCSQAQVSLAISGVAGPGGGTLDKPVGTVWVAWAVHEQGVSAEKFRFMGDRRAVRAQAVEQALLGVLGAVEALNE